MTDTNEKTLSIEHIIEAVAFLETTRSYLGATMEAGYYREWMVSTMGKHIKRLRDVTDLTPE